MKLSTGQFSATEQTALFAQIYQLLDEQDAREFRIKARLYQVFEQWRDKHKLRSVAPLANKAELSL